MTISPWNPVVILDVCLYIYNNTYYILLPIYPSLIDNTSHDVLWLDAVISPLDAKWHRWGEKRLLITIYDGYFFPNDWWFFLRIFRADPPSHPHCMTPCPVSKSRRPHGTQSHSWWTDLHSPTWKSGETAAGWSQTKLTIGLLPEWGEWSDHPSSSTKNHPSIISIHPNLIIHVFIHILIHRWIPFPKTRNASNAPSGIFPRSSTSPSCAARTKRCKGHLL